VVGCVLPTTFESMNAPAAEILSLPGGPELEGECSDIASSEARVVLRGEQSGMRVKSGYGVCFFESSDYPRGWTGGRSLPGDCSGSGGSFPVSPSAWAEQFF
jgi:hypothetical protein